MVVMGLLSDGPLVKALLVVIGTAPSAMVWLTGFAIGALTSWSGWQAGKRRTVGGVAAQAA